MMESSINEAEVVTASAEGACTSEMEVGGFLTSSDQVVVAADSPVVGSVQLLATHALQPMVASTSDQKAEAIDPVSLQQLPDPNIVHQQQIEQLVPPQDEDNQQDVMAKQLQDVADFCSTSGIENMGGVNVATTTIDGQQVIIVTDSSGGAPGLPEHTIVDEEEDAPPSKQIKLASDLQPAYVLSLQGVTDPSETGEQEVDADMTENSLTAANSHHLLQVNTEDCLGEKGKAGEVTVSQAWFTTRDDKTALHKKGHSWKLGQWSKDEVDLLHANIQAYCQENSITCPQEVIFEMSKDERKDFYRTVARGLNRPLFSVYRRVIRMYDQKNYVGKYTPGELEKLRKLREKHGSDWATIGTFLGRSASSVKDRCRLMKDTCNSGKWLPVEEQRLAEAVYELSNGQPGESIVGGLSWAAVADRVATRTEKQCRTKWLNYLNWKQKGGAEWTRDDDMRLINRIAECGINDETHLDWIALAEGWPSARSPQWLRGKWWSLKRHIPQYNLLPFQDLVKSVQQLYSQTVHNKSSVPASNTLTSTPLGMQPLSFLPLAIPVALPTPEGYCGVGIDAESLSSGQIQVATDTSSGVQYEILQAIPGQQGALFITQPQAGTALNTVTGLTTDQVIVQALPVCQQEDDDGQTASMPVGSISGQQMILTAQCETPSSSDLPPSDTCTTQELEEEEHTKADTELCDLANAALHAAAVEQSTVQKLGTFTSQVISEDGKTNCTEQTQQDIINLGEAATVANVQSHTLVLPSAVGIPDSCSLTMQHVNNPSLVMEQGGAISENVMSVAQEGNVESDTANVEHSNSHEPSVKNATEAEDLSVGQSSCLQNQLNNIEENNEEGSDTINISQDATHGAVDVSLVINEADVVNTDQLTIGTGHTESSSDDLAMSTDHITGHQSEEQSSLAHLSSTADPMFPADEADLMAASDIDAEKEIDSAS